MTSRIDWETAKNDNSSLKSRLPDPYDYPPRRALSLQYESSSSNPEKFNTMEGLDIKEIRITAENIDPIHEELTSSVPVHNYAAQTDDEDAVYDVPRQLGFLFYWGYHVITHYVVDKIT